MKKLTFILLYVVLFSSYAQKEPVFATKEGAIRGYDAVAYFEQGKAIEGSDTWTYEWQGAPWLFESEDNLNKFKANPEDYAPQFGGYCAYAVSQGYTYEVDPTAWKIVDNKLYLNYSKSIQQKWERNQAENIKKGEVNWPKLIK